MEPRRDDPRPAILARDRLSKADALPARDALADFAADDSPGHLPALQAHGAPATGVSQSAAPHPRAARGLTLKFAAVLGTAGLAAFLLAYFTSPYLGVQRRAAAPPPAGEISIDSQPPGAQVVVDGAARGATPLVLTLPAGEHELEVSLGNVSRQRTMTIRGGATASHFVEFSPPAQSPAPPQAAAPAPSPVRAAGRVEVSSDRPGAPVRIDGVRRGVTPLTLNRLPAGEHRVTVGDGPSAIERVVTVAPDSLASVVVTLGAQSPGAGWLSISVPFEMQISEGPVVLGTTAANRTMLPAGRHVLQLNSPALNFRTSVAVNIEPGATAVVSVSVPQGTLSVNAAPWAEVTIDGRAVGPTPLGNLSLPIGAHEIVWRHPNYGERRQSVLVRAETPTRVAVDFATP